MSERCAVCNDEGWVCENHADKPWNASGCECGAGMPCRECNPSDRDTPPRMPPGSKTIFDKDGWRH
jgi:hypothetical protein